MRDRLGASLPHYMVPVAFHWRESLPLTANGKIDTKALTALAAELAVTDSDDRDGFEPPISPTEVRVAAAWEKVLGVAADQIGRHDHFFDLGGSSLSAVKLAVALNRVVSLKDVIRHPVLAELAELIDSRQAPIDEPDGDRSFAVTCRYA
jgi:phosphopantetheine binding protein